MTVTGVRRAGERGVVLDTDDEPAGLARALHVLGAQLGISLQEVVPGAVTVLVVAANPSELTRLVTALPRLAAAEGDLATKQAATVEIPVSYTGPDLDDVAKSSGLTVAEVIRRHSEVTYRAAFTGFAPGFAYLTGLDPALRLPRRSSPRPSVPPGSVAIADSYSAIYPRASPGGWHLLGSTQAVIFDPLREPPAVIAPGASVRFLPQCLTK